MNREPGAEDLFKKIGEAYEVRLAVSRQPVIAILCLLRCPRRNRATTIRFLMVEARPASAVRPVHRLYGACA